MADMEDSLNGKYPEINGSDLVSDAYEIQRAINAAANSRCTLCNETGTKRHGRVLWTPLGHEVVDPVLCDHHVDTSIPIK